MEALGYLLARRWPSGVRLAGLLLVGVLMSWLSLRLALVIPHVFDGPLSHPGVALLWGAFVMLAGLLAIATALALLLVVPLFSLYRCGTTLAGWIRKRCLREMSCTGLSSGKVLDMLVLWTTAWWLGATVPGLLTGALLFPQLRPPWLALALGGLPLLGLAGGYFALSLVAWSNVPGGRTVRPAAGVVLAVQMLPLPLLLRLGVSSWSLLAAGLWVALVGRALALRGLEGWPPPGSSGRQPAAWGPTERRPPAWQGICLGQQLAENPILARELMRGSRAAGSTRGALLAAFFALVSALSLSSGALWVFAFLLVPVVLMNSYRLARGMAVAVQREVDGGTLEALRSTPMDSASFLRGWLYAVVAPCWVEHTALLTAVALVILLMGKGALLLSPSLVIAGCLSLLLPLTSAYVGAGIAGQARGRERVVNLLLLAYALLLAALSPPLLALTGLISLPLSLFLLAVATLAICWALHRGATRNLDQYLLPQP